MPPELPDLHFGEITEEPVEPVELSVDEADEEAEEDTPAGEDLIELLGFDPDKLDES